MFAIARQTLRDLCRSQPGGAAVRALRPAPARDGRRGRKSLAEAFEASAEPALVRSAFDIPAAQRAAIEAAVAETVSARIGLRYDTSPDLVAGIELSANGQKLAWNIADYLAGLEKSVGELLREVVGSAGGNGIVAQPLQRILEGVLEAIGEAREAFVPQLLPQEVGTIGTVSTDRRITGLPGVGSEELVRFGAGVQGFAFNVDPAEVGVVLLGDYSLLRAGDEVRREGRVMDVAVGECLLGRVIDPLGRLLDELGPVVGAERLPIERPAAPIMDRAPVAVPLQTGIKVIDALIPVGRGQRELILGDRRTGKTTIAIDTILNQRDQDVLCIYCAIGQRAAAVARAVAVLRERGALAYTVVIVSEGNDPPGLTYIAPYAATSIAEHFMESGRDVLIVYDDLTQHARPIASCRCC